MFDFAKSLKTIHVLIIISLFLAFFLILLSNTGILPMKMGDFIFFTLVVFALALYRPGWAFLFLISTLAFENISLAPESLGIAVRPYQLIGGLTMLAVLIRLIFKKLNFRIARLYWYDYSLILIAIMGFVGALAGTDRGTGLKQALVLSSFVALYLLARNFIQNREDISKITPFAIAPSFVVMLYGLWQNWRFVQDLNPFETMPGRPNGTFSEPDWLGIYLVLTTSLILCVAYCFKNNEIGDSKETSYKSSIIKSFSYIFLTLGFALLIITVSRSAWIGTAAALFLMLFTTLTDLRFNPKNWNWRPAANLALLIASSLLLGLIAIKSLELTRFQLGNRAASTGGLQKITVSCNTDIKLPELINFTDELGSYGCRHINLEDIGSEKTAGKVIKEVHRNDPNVTIRSEIYKKSWNEIRKNWLFGIGWGNISQILGTDERGAGLNASNMFLEVWLGSGIIGLLAFLSVWLYAILSAIRNFFLSSEYLPKALALFMIASWTGLTIANLFNSGILLGFLWIWLAAAVMKNRD